MRHTSQDKLFETGLSLPNGLVYRPDFITADEEFKLLAAIDLMPLALVEPKFKNQQSRGRRYAWFGDPLPSFIEPTARKIVKWLAIPRARIRGALINEYPAGSQMGFHRDSEPCEHIVGISIGGWATMKWRPFYKIDRGYDTSIKLDLEPRSAYIMQKEIRDDWQHAVSETRGYRISITFRTEQAATGFW